MQSSVPFRKGADTGRPYVLHQLPGMEATEEAVAAVTVGTVGQMDGAILRRKGVDGRILRQDGGWKRKAGQKQGNVVMVHHYGIPLLLAGLLACWPWTARGASQQVYIARDADGTAIITDAPPRNVPPEQVARVRVTESGGTAPAPDVQLPVPAAAPAPVEAAAAPQDAAKQRRVQEILAAKKHLERQRHRAAVRGDTGKRTRLRRKIEALDSELQQLR